MTLTELRQRIFVSVAEAAVILGCDERTVRRAIDDGQVPAIKVGAKTSIPAPKLLALIEPSTLPAPADIAEQVNPDVVRGAVDMIKAGLRVLEPLLRTTDIADIGGGDGA